LRGDWSYSLLSAAEQLLLGRVSVVAGGFDLAAAEVVCGFRAVDVLEVGGLQGSLQDKSMVVAEPADGSVRYRLLETIRPFAADRLAAAEGDEAAAVVAATARVIWLSLRPPRPIWRARTRAAGSIGSRLMRLTCAELSIMLLRNRTAPHSCFVLALPCGAIGSRGPEMRRRQGCSCPCCSAQTQARTERYTGRRCVFAALVTVFTDLTTAIDHAEKADEVAADIGDNRLLHCPAERCAGHAAGLAIWSERGNWERNLWSAPGNSATTYFWLGA
jgi:hypothetical protein